MSNRSCSTCPHLHVRSGFSYGLGTATPEELACATARMGYRSLALTDRDGLYGIPRFLQASQEAGLCAIVGTEVTVQLRKPDVRGHLVLLVDSERGYRTLCRLLTAFLSPAVLAKSGSPWPSARERRNPACDLQMLLEGAGEGGLVCLSGAIPFGLVPSLVLSRDTGLRRKSREVLCLLRETFGEGNVFVELTDDGTAGSRRRMRQVEALAKREGLPTIAAHEVTYLRPEDYRLSDPLAAAHHLSALPPPNFVFRQRRSATRILGCFHSSVNLTIYRPEIRL
jgi:error-prone DNA polymerase